MLFAIYALVARPAGAFVLFDDGFSDVNFDVFISKRVQTVYSAVKILLCILDIIFHVLHFKRKLSHILKRFVSLLKCHSCVLLNLIIISEFLDIKDWTIFKAFEK